MNANFNYCHSKAKSTSRLAPKPPTRRGSIDMKKRMTTVSAVSTNLSTSFSQSSAASNHNAVFEGFSRIPTRGSLQREQPASLLNSKQSSSCVIFDYASRQRLAAPGSIVITRANSYDRSPTIPKRKPTPMKERPCPESNSYSWRHACADNKTICVQKVTEKESAAIRKPNIKSNIFFSGSTLKASKSNRIMPLNQAVLQLEDRTPPTAQPKSVLRTRTSPTSVLHTKHLDTSNNDQERWNLTSFSYSAKISTLPYISDQAETGNVVVESKRQSLLSW